MKGKKKAVLFVFIVLTHGKTWAADKEMEPGMLPLGPFDLTPLLSVQESYNDNIFHNDQNRKGSFITQITGGGELALRRKLDRYALRYGFLSSQYHSSPTDNYVDNTIGATAHVEFTRRNRLDFNSGLVYGHYMRGTVLSQGSIAARLTEPDQYHQYHADIDYRYGRVDARGNLGLQLGWSQLVYDNHPERTSQWDRSQFEITPGFYLRLMPKTYLTMEIENNIVEYDNSDAQADSFLSSTQNYTAQRYLLGLAWDQSSKTKGKFRAGYLQQEFSDSSIKGIEDFTWDGRIIWSPLTYSTFNFGLIRNVYPSINNGSGYSRKVQVYEAGWTHEWPKDVTTQLNGSYQEVNNQGALQPTNGVSLSFDMKYAMKPWLSLGLNYSYSTFQYQTNNNNSTQNIVMFYVNATPSAKTYN